MQAANKAPIFDVADVQFKNALTGLTVSISTSDEKVLSTALANDRHALAALITPFFWWVDNHSLAIAPDAILINKHAEFPWCNLTDSRIFLKYQQLTLAKSGLTSHYTGECRGCFPTLASQLTWHSP
jgi:hypothetical protein